MKSKHSGMIEMDNLFYTRVYEAVAQIPMGRVATYSAIAELAGYPGASREAGLAMSRALWGSELPYHRVVNKNGTLAPGYAFGSPERQKQLLESEGISFLHNGIINMDRHIWPCDVRMEQMTLF